MSTLDETVRGRGDAGLETAEAPRPPATLQVCRYVAKSRTLHLVVGDFDIGVPDDDLRRHAVEALRRAEFMCYTVSTADQLEADDLCFVPHDGWCDILSIRTNGWRRHHGDHRRSLNEILGDLAGAVACGKLRILSVDELEAQREDGQPLARVDLGGAASLGGARRTIDAALCAQGLDHRERASYVLCISEAATNMLIHGGGTGTLALRLLDDRLRAVVADEGPGLNFVNWMDPPCTNGQASMGYGLKIILDNLDTVGLHTGETGTTLLLDRMTT